jgi:hypothetical protein
MRSLARGEVHSLRSTIARHALQKIVSTICIGVRCAK